MALQNRHRCRAFLVESRFERITPGSRVDQKSVGYQKEAALGIRHCELKSRFTSVASGKKQTTG